jgi:hypothetical protein
MEKRHIRAIEGVIFGKARRIYLPLFLPLAEPVVDDIVLVNLPDCLRRVKLIIRIDGTIQGKNRRTRSSVGLLRRALSIEISLNRQKICILPVPRLFKPFVLAAGSLKRDKFSLVNPIPLSFIIMKSSVWVSSLRRFFSVRKCTATDIDGVKASTAFCRCEIASSEFLIASFKGENISLPLPIRSQELFRLIFCSRISIFVFPFFYQSDIFSFHKGREGQPVDMELPRCR